MSTNGYSRRSFLVAGSAAGLGMAAVILLKNNGNGESDVALCISKEGKLYEVRVEDLQKALHKGHLTNRDLEAWCTSNSRNKSPEL